MGWGERELGAIVEVAVAVVVEAGGDVIGGVALRIEVGADLDFEGQVEGGVAEGLPKGVAGLAGVLAAVGQIALRREEGVVVGVAVDVDAHGSKEELQPLEFLLAEADELDVADAAAVAYEAVDVEV